MKHDCLPIIIVLALVLCSPLQKENSKYSFEEIEVAKVISAEACSEGKIGMWTIANTIANRVKSWEKTPYEIVTQPRQYYGYINPNKDRIYKHCKSDANKISRNIMKLKDITEGAIYYLMPNEHIKSWHGEKTITIGLFTLYKEN